VPPFPEMVLASARGARAIGHAHLKIVAGAACAERSIALLGSTEEPVTTYHRARGSLSSRAAVSTGQARGAAESLGRIQVGIAHFVGTLDAVVAYLHALLAAVADAGSVLQDVPDTHVDVCVSQFGVTPGVHVDTCV